MKHKTKVIALLFGSVILTGCTSTSSDRYIELKTEVIKLEHEVNNVDLKTAQDEDVNDGFPVWVLNPASVFDVAYGVGCQVFPDADFNNQQKVKSIALDKARLELFRLTTAKQNMYAEESVERSNGKSNYSAQIYSKSYGSIGRNKINRDGKYKEKGQIHYCVAVTLVY